MPELKIDMTYITTLATAKPQHKYDQSALADFMVNYMSRSEGDDRMIRYLFEKSKINSRYSVLPDFTEKGALKKLYTDKHPTVGQRMEVFQQEALPLAQEACAKAMKMCDDSDQLPTHIITISCTGMHAPGLELELCQLLKLPANTERLAINFMGCYAAFQGMKMADYICKTTPDAKVLVVAVELCSLHFLADFNESQLRANALFADGAAAMIISNKAGQKPWKLSAFTSQFLSKGEKDMTWKIANEAFKMDLSAYVPALIQSGIRPLLDGCLSKLLLTTDQIDTWAIHPGGVKILEAFEKEMKLDKNALQSSRKILAEYGNMSSVTILVLLESLWSAEEEAKDRQIFAAGFGPGLSLEAAVIHQLASK